MKSRTFYRSTASNSKNRTTLGVNSYEGFNLTHKTRKANAERLDLTEQEQRSFSHNKK